MNTRIPAAFALAALCHSCTYVPRASPEEDARAKTFTTRPDMCGVYVYREGSDGGSTELEVLLDGRVLGRSSGGDFLFTWVQPGSHTLESRSDGDMQISFDAARGGLVFVRQEGTMGYWTIASKFLRVSEEEGKRAVQKCVLVASGF